MNNKGSRIIVIDDEEGMCKLLREILKDAGYSVTTHTSAERALRQIAEESYDIAIVDIKMPGMDGIEFLKKAKELRNTPDIIMITAYGSIENAVEAIKFGAYDYITKPFQSEEITVAVEKIFERRKLINENIRLRREIEKMTGRESMIAQSSIMRDIVTFAKKVANSDLGVLVTGESGTGKEVLARLIHDASVRREGPFVPVQCGLLPLNLLESELFGFKKGSFTGATEDRPGLFEQSNEGTLFLDEIGDISTDIQGKLLRFLQDHEVRRIGETKSRHLSVRLVSATNKNLEASIREGKFREDLFFRLKVITIHMPPLRERIEDIPLLAHHFLAQVNRTRTKSAELDSRCIPHLMKYSWPGNVRELKNCIESASVICDENIIHIDDINRILASQNIAYTMESESFRESKARVIEKFEKKFIINSLIRNKGNIAAAARISRIDRKNLWQMIKKYNIHPEDYKEPEDK